MPQYINLEQTVANFSIAQLEHIAAGMKGLTTEEQGLVEKRCEDIAYDRQKFKELGLSPSDYTNLPQTAQQRIWAYACLELRLQRATNPQALLSDYQAGHLKNL